MHGFADHVVTPERKADVGDAAGDERAGEVRLDPPGGFDEVEGVAGVLRHAGGDREDVGVEDDVMRGEADLTREDAVGALADVDAAL